MIIGDLRTLIDEVAAAGAKVDSYLSADVLQLLFDRPGGRKVGVDGRCGITKLGIARDGVGIKTICLQLCQLD